MPVWYTAAGRAYFREAHEKLLNDPEAMERVNKVKAYLDRPLFGQPEVEEVELDTTEDQVPEKTRTRFDIINED
jgi:O-methyltransferase involved in polyketide biosynthesis